MKKKIAFLLGFAIVIALTFSPRPAFGADTTTKAVASTTVITPLYNGTEKNLVDSLQSVLNALQDPSLKSTVSNAISTIEATPKTSTFWTWAAYLLAIVGVLFGVFHYVSAKLQNTAIWQNIEKHLGVLASPAILQTISQDAGAAAAIITNLDAKPAAAPVDKQAPEPAPDAVKDQPAPEPAAAPLAPVVDETKLAGTVAPAVESLTGAATIPAALLSKGIVIGTDAAGNLTITPVS